MYNCEEQWSTVYREDMALFGLILIGEWRLYPAIDFNDLCSVFHALSFLIPLEHTRDWQIIDENVENIERF